MSQSFNLSRAGRIAAILMCTTSIPAFAQTAASAPQSAEASSGGLEEIVVTAQRRSERLEAVPMAVTALTPIALERANVVNIQDISRISPGVQISFAGAFLQPSIRGVTALTNGFGNENNVAVYIDGFYVADTTSINTDLVNLQSVQVLKGPQGTLYGRQATGGAILINTIDPTDELSGRFTGSYGRFKDKRIAGYISGPLSDNLLFMASGSFRNTDGHNKKSDPNDRTKDAGPATPVKQRSIRTKLLWKASDSLKATLAYNYSFVSDGSGLLFTPQAFFPSNATNNGNARAVGDYRRSFNHKTFAVSESNEVTLKVEWQNSLGTLTSYSGYVKRRNRNMFDFDGTYVDSTSSDNTGFERAYQQSIDYVINAIDRVDLVVGGFYLHDYVGCEGEQARRAYNANRALGTQLCRPLTTDAIAVYADATYKVTDAFSIGVGGRYSSDKRKVSQMATFNASPTPIAAVSAKKTFNKFTPRVTARYELAPRTNVYATWSKGFRSGSYNANSNPNAVLATIAIKPETLTAYEVGFKTANRTFRFETAAFYYDYRNLNTSLTVPNPLGPQFGAATIIGNAPKAKIKGIEAQVVAELVERLNVQVGATYLHARYGTFINAAGTGINATGDGNVSQPTQDWSGNQLARAPDFSANVAVDYTVGLAGGDLRFSANARYTDSYVNDNPSVFGVLAPAAMQKKQRYRQGSYTLVGGEIKWSDPTDHYSIGVYGTNLTSAKYRVNYSGSAAGDYWAYAAPISYGVKVEYKF